MSYTNYESIQRILPENVRIGDQNIGSPSPGRPGSGSNRSNLSPADTQYYIDYAQQYIDGKLRPFYVCPLRRIKSYQTEVLNNLSAGTNITVDVHDSGSFIRGNLVRIQDVSTMETANVIDTPTLTTLRLDRLTNSYLSANSLVISILEYPDPIPVIAARLASSFILDRLYVSTQSPDISNYGKSQRNLSTQAIEDILRGAIILQGQEFTGRRFVRAPVLDRWSTPVEVTKGEEKEG